MNFEYRVFAAGSDGNYEHIGSTTQNFLIFDAKNICKVYIEKRTEIGGLISESQRINVKANSDEFIDITAVNSYKGITLNWSSKDICGNFFILKRSGRQYSFIYQDNTAQYTVEQTDKRTVIKILEFDSKGNLLKLSHDFTVTPDCCKKIDPPDEIKLSVIIPAYNNELFLSKCMDSVLSSSMRDYEVILIDDGSVDKTAEIADWYQENYKETVFAVHTPNQGAAEARNVGIRRARGNYITFADSDDLVASDMYETLYNSAAELDCDISVCKDYQIIYGGKNGCALYIEFCLPQEEHKSYSTDELLKLTYAHKYMNVAMWNKIYRTSIVKEHLVPRLKYEDAAWSPIIYSFSETFCFTNKPMYVYNRMVEEIKPTLSNEFAKMSYDERARERITSYRLLVEEGNQSKREYLLLVCMRLILVQLSDDKKETESSAKILYDYLVEHKEEIKSNKLITADIQVMADLKKISKKYNLDLI